MPLTDVDICNSALLWFGSRVAASITSPSTNEEKLCARFYAQTRDAVLRAHDWNCALKRAVLLTYTKPAATLTPAAVSGTAVTFTAGAAVFTSAAVDVGRILVNKTAGKLGRATVVGFTDTIHVTADITENFTDTTAIASQSWWYHFIPPAWGFSFSAALPADYLRIATSQDDEERGATATAWRVEGRSLLTDAESTNIKYVFQNTDPTTYDSLFVEALWTALAVKIALPITGKKDKLEAASAMYQAAVREARGVDRGEAGGNPGGERWDGGDDHPLLTCRL